MNSKLCNPIERTELYTRSFTLHASPSGENIHYWCMQEFRRSRPPRVNAFMSPEHRSSWRDDELQTYLEAYSSMHCESKLKG